jgi:signal peptidase I
MHWQDSRFRPVLPLLIAILVVLVTQAYLRLYNLTGTSAAPSVLLGDKLIVNRAAYRLMLPYSQVQLFRTGSPRRGDLVQEYLKDRRALVFKRVMGLPGETFEIREDRIFINGLPIPLQPLDRADFNWVPTIHRIGSAVWNEDGHWIAFTPGVNEHANYPPITLGDNQYFLLGDNRDNSVDSRQWGPIPGDHILGKVIAVLHTGPRVNSRQ